MGRENLQIDCNRVNILQAVLDDFNLFRQRIMKCKEKLRRLIFECHHRLVSLELIFYLTIKNVQNFLPQHDDYLVVADFFNL
jgi:hypothetical protein